MTAFFDKIIAPCSVEAFFNTYHEKQVLHIRRNDPAYYNTVLTAAEISAFLDRQDVFYPSLRIVKNGNEVPAAAYTLKGVPIGHHKRDGIIHTEKAFALFNEGATLVIQAGQRYFDHLSACCMALSRKFNAPVQANLYITPNRSQGFNPHWDTHDVFVLQISGTKTWHLYGFEKELPTKNQGFVSKGYNKAPEQTLQLQPGDFLYVPRGYVHDAVADDGISAHITIGILSFTWIRYFSELLMQLENEKAFREAVPFWSKDLDAAIGEKTELLKETISRLARADALRKLDDQYQKMQPQLVQGYFNSLLQLNDLGADTVLEVNRNVFYERENLGDQCFLKCFGKTISFPGSLKPAIDHIFDSENFTVAALPGEQPETVMMEAVTQLVREGVVFISNSNTI
ncbi:cupin domain-containing protein [Niabella drilacis]|uniref:Cupin superfamily protein n=1 Tax=Niabella drilacis (strain DSM 25811 / CCM 8410 / CCUG 62505 / LMG 26954 / E90) TaxID=1285928 RepID=A0A1G6JNH1_NIADE|nr:cupin domain-containing protein [Niabella drilacis]SDC20218.1 Cupin superfamily protein [Niabella drilacis]